MSKLKSYKLLTVTHKTANLKRIGDYVLKVEETRQLKLKIDELKKRFGFEELLYVATCNRVMYLFTGETIVDDTFVEEFFTYINPSLFTNSPSSVLSEVSNYQGVEALSHIYEVASSIDSLVVGEREILRQLRDAYDQCSRWKVTGDKIRLLMRFVVSAAKSVYSNTRIGEKPVSVVSLAAKKLLESKFPRNSKILLIGAGQTNTLVSKFLLKYQFNYVTVFNRNLERAKSLANKFGWDYQRLEDLENYKKGFDIIIICTGATKPIVTKSLYEKLLNGDEHRKLIIDIAVPHNVSCDVVTNFNTQYIEIEDIKALAKKNLAFRENEVGKAKELLAKEIEDFEGYYKERQVEIAMRSIPKEIKAVKSKAMNEVFKKEVEALDDNTRALMERMLTYMEKKCISIPMKVAKNVVMNANPNS